MIAYIIRSVIKVDISHDKPDFVSIITTGKSLNIYNYYCIFLLQIFVCSFWYSCLTTLKNVKLQRKHEERSRGITIKC